jgi:Flp pilus assembly protein TadG
MARRLRAVLATDARGGGDGRDGSDGRDGGNGADGGTAIIEFVFVAVIVMVPLVYLLVAVAVVQRSQLAVTQAAREAGRAFATTDTASDADLRVLAAVRLALAAQRLPDDVQLRFVAAGSSCDGPAVAPKLAPAAQFTVCISRRVAIPAVPRILAGRGITTVGQYVVHVDDFRTVG